MGDRSLWGWVSGEQRWIVLCGSLVLKSPRTAWGNGCLSRFRLGLRANQQEARFSLTGWPELCPVVAKIPGGLLNVMLRAKPLSDEEWSEFDYQSFVARCSPDDPWWHERSMAAGYAIAPAEGLVPAECKPNSFGVLRRRIVAVDYGGG
jgi:hypothetical protein